MHIPSNDHYMSLQRGWIIDHMYFMGIEERRDVDPLNATFDFIHGNDNFPDGNPTSEFKEHLSPRGLTWEQEYRIFYVQTVILPALWTQRVHTDHHQWAQSKVTSLLRDGLSEAVILETLGELILPGAA